MVIIRSWVVAVHIRRLTRLVLVAAVLLGLSWQADGQLQVPAPSASQEENRGPGIAHLQLMEDSVTTLASILPDVYPANCDSISCETCSHDECLPINGHLSCANVSHNARCNNFYPNCVSTMKVSFERSSIAYPRAPDRSGPDYPQTRTICGTVALDSTFQSVYKKSPYHSEYYVGFPDGSRRSYPGREEADPGTLHGCKEYDCRLRPWYNAAISNRTHLVILVDSRRAEPLDASYTEKNDTLTFAKELVHKLLATMSAGDRVNIVPFSSAATAAALKKDSVEVAFNWSDPQTHKELEPLMRELDKVTSLDEMEMTQSNLTAGLQEALRLFSAVKGMMSQNVLVFTNGNVAYDNSTLDQLYGNLVRLFVISTKNTDDKLRVLDTVAASARGAHIRLPPTTSDNPMYELRAYFAYLANLQVLSNRTRPFWTPPYRDYYDIGEIITVVAPGDIKGWWVVLAFRCYPPSQIFLSGLQLIYAALPYHATFSKSGGRLIGVAAVDVLYEELGEIKEEFRRALADRPDNGGFITSNMFESIPMTVYNDKSMESCDIKGMEMALCTPDKKINPKDDGRERFCCSECTADRGSGRQWTLQIALPTALGFFSLVVLSLVAVRYLQCRRSARRVDECDSSEQEKKSGSSRGRKSSDSVVLGSPTAKTAELAINSSGTPAKIYKTAVRLGFTTSGVEVPSRQAE